MKEFFLEQQDRYDAHGNGCIGYIKNRAEEFKILAAHERKPMRIVGPYQGEVKHVHDAAMQETGIAMMRKDPRDMIVAAFFKDQPIKHAVQEIAQRPGKYQTRTDDESPVIFFVYDASDIKDPEQDGDQPEKREYHFSTGAPEFPTPGHPFIFHKIDLRLITQQFDAIVIRRHRHAIGFLRMAKRHMRFYPDLQRLVSHDDKQHDQKNISRLHVFRC